MKNKKIFFGATVAIALAVILIIIINILELEWKRSLKKLYLLL